MPTNRKEHAMAIRNIEQLEAAIYARLAELHESNDETDEAERLEYLLVEIKDAVHRGDIHKLAAIGRKYGTR